MAEDPRAPKNESKTLLGHYKLLEKLAQGGMAEIYKAETYDPNGLKRHVVIKRILPHVSSQQEFIDMLIDEAKIAVQFNHGNIAQIYDLGKVKNDYFIVMEYVEGKTLQQIFKRAEALQQKLPVPHVLYFLSELCAGLSYMHRKTDEAGNPLHVVHRDISPQNVIVSYAGNVKIIDFGIAKAADKITVTESGVLKGKFAYMSPEQAAGDDIDARSDIFAAGVVLWELLTGERLFRRKNNKETLKAVKKAEIPSVQDYNPAAPKDLQKIIRKTLVRSLRKRYRDAADLQADLTRILYRYYPEFKPSHVGPYLESLFSTNPNPPVASEPRAKIKVAAPTADDVEEATRKEKIVPRLDAISPRRLEGEVTEKRSRRALEKKPASPIEVGEETQWVKVEDIDMAPVIHAVEDEEDAIEATRIHHEQDEASPEEKKNLPEHIEEDAQAVIPYEPSVPSAVSLSEPISDEPRSRSLRFLIGALGVGIAMVLLVFWASLHRQRTVVEVVYPPVPAVVEAPQPAPELPKPVPVRDGFLIIESDPPGADIFIDDRQTGKTTPTVIEAVTAGVVHRVGLAGPKFKYQEQSVTVASGENKKLSFKLEINKGVFSFVSVPDGADVTLNGEVIGQTPVLNYALDPDTIVKLRYTKEGFEPWETEFKVFGGENRKITRELKSVLSPVL